MGKKGFGKKKYIDILKARFNNSRHEWLRAKKFSATERAYKEDMLDARDKLVALGATTRKYYGWE